ncbi:ribosome biogenesis GTP-binding protein YihA/YsxC [uncultured Finegoldia sp.]|uniref:ribosome biogenesis GTP-binding protein YihA/YsxC n=1 Tax=uncultured Finegoldia sp. TaxID=328009 RepID=UPI00261FDC46|nr:ribosome biogenesis GTP-binding protein YihA/YsxC [uncultured Finegoldia sp.]
MKIKYSDLEKIAFLKEQYPDESLPEIAFCGRSNVGKSSFINSILDRKNLARTSSKPGKTRTVNFYIANGEFRLVDLPGYGYAQTSKSEKKKWAKVIETYLNNRKNLYEVFLIVDIRHKPTLQDKQMYNWVLESGFCGFVIATKLDKIGKTMIKKNLNIIKKELQINDDNLIYEYSSTSKQNKTSIMEQLELILKYGNGMED